MGLQTYKIYYSADGGVFNDLTNVQNITINIGRQNQLDQIKTSTASFEMRYPTGYASPITGLVAGSFIYIENATAVGYPVWYGKATDVTAVYGIPYSGGVGQSDYLSVSCEGSFAALGRMQGNSYAMAAGTVTAQLSNAQTQTGVAFNYSTTTSPQNIAATTVSSTWADWVARLCQSINARIWDGRSHYQTTVVNPFKVATSGVNFSDVANNSTNQVYNQINFHSLSDNFYTQVTVTPESFGPATVTKSGATVPYRTYQTNTLNASTAEATDYANYLLNNYSVSQVAIASITCMAEAQSSFQLDKLGGAFDFSSIPGSQVSVTFRGTTYNCIMEGATMSATPAGASFTYYVSGADLNAYLILNNTVFGTLDNNRLGY